MQNENGQNLPLLDKPLQLKAPQTRNQKNLRKIASATIRPGGLSLEIALKCKTKQSKKVQ